MTENAIGLGAAILVLLLGLFVVRISLWPRRRGSEASCARCGYRLTGNVSGVCPECGTNLADKPPRLGVRRRRPVLATLGIFVTLVGLVGTIAAAEPFYRQIDWYAFKPTSWVIRDTESAVPSDAQRAWNELVQRRKNGKLSSGHEQAIIAASLREHAKFNAGALGVDMVEHLGQLERDGKLTDAQRNQFFAQVVQINFTVRPLVLVRQRVPFSYNGTRRTPAGEWYIRVTLDGSHELGMSGGGPQGNHLGGRGTLEKTVFDTPGAKSFRIPQHIEIFRGEQPDRAKLAWEGDANSPELTTEVLSARTPQYLTAIPDNPELRAAVEKSVRVTEFGYVRPEYFEFTLEANTPPVNLAFECFARVDGKEVRLGDVAFKRGAGRHSYGMGAYRLEPLNPKRADIILRPSPKAAAGTVDLFDYWDGEIVFKDVPVANPK